MRHADLNYIIDLLKKADYGAELHVSKDAMEDIEEYAGSPDFQDAVQRYFPFGVPVFIDESVDYAVLVQKEIVQP